MNSDSLKSKMRAGAIFWWLGNTSSRLSRVAVYVVLAWMLDPHDFGLVAMTTAIMMLLQILSEFGVGIAVIQKKDITPEYVNTAFWLNVGVSIVMTGVAWIGAPWLAKFYGEPAVTLLVRVSSLGFMATALRTIPMALLRKDLKFGYYAVLDAGFRIVTNVGAIAFALAGAKYWSLVIPNLAVGLIMIPVWFHYAAWRPSRLFNREIFREIFGYTKNVVVVALATFVLSNAGFVFAGYFMDTDAAGIYKFAMENSMFVLYNLAWSIASVSISGFAIEVDKQKLRSAFGRVYDIQLASSLPLLTLLFVLAPLIFGGIFPDKWIPAIPFFRILLTCALVRAITGHVAQYYYAVNRPHVNVRYTSVMLVLLLPSMFLGCKYQGLMGLAAATAVGTALVALPMLGLSARLNNWEGMDWFRRSTPCVIAAGVLACAAYAAHYQFRNWGMPPAANFFASSAVGGVVYLVTLFVIARQHLRGLVEDAVPDRIRAKYFQFLVAEKAGA